MMAWRRLVLTGALMGTMTYAATAAPLPVDAPGAKQEASAP